MGTLVLALPEEMRDAQIVAEVVLDNELGEAIGNAVDDAPGGTRVDGLEKSEPILRVADGSLGKRREEKRERRFSRRRSVRVNKRGRGERDACAVVVPCASTKEGGEEKKTPGDSLRSPSTERPDRMSLFQREHDATTHSSSPSTRREQ